MIQHEIVRGQHHCLGTRVRRRRRMCSRSHPASSAIHASARPAPSSPRPAIAAARARPAVPSSALIAASASVGPSGVRHRRSTGPPGRCPEGSGGKAAAEESTAISSPRCEAAAGSPTRPEGLHVGGIAAAGATLAGLPGGPLAVSGSHSARGSGTRRRLAHMGPVTPAKSTTMRLSRAWAAATPAAERGRRTAAHAA